MREKIIHEMCMYCFLHVRAGTNTKALIALIIIEELDITDSTQFMFVSTPDGKGISEKIVAHSNSIRASQQRIELFNTLVATDKNEPEG